MSEIHGQARTDNRELTLHVIPPLQLAHQRGNGREPVLVERSSALQWVGCLRAFWEYDRSRGLGGGPRRGL